MDHSGGQVIQVSRLVDLARVRLGRVGEHVDGQRKVHPPFHFLGNGKRVLEALVTDLATLDESEPTRVTNLQLHAQDRRQFLDLQLFGRLLWRPTTTAAVVHVGHELFWGREALQATIKSGSRGSPSAQLPLFCLYLNIQTQIHDRILSLCDVAASVAGNAAPDFAVECFMKEA